MNMKFIPIPAKVPVKVDAELLHNSDLNHLYNLSILTGLGTKKASQKQINAFFCQPGTVTAARWVTTACNLLTLYLQEDKPSKNLKLMVQIIQNFRVTVTESILLSIRYIMQFFVGFQKMAVVFSKDLQIFPRIHFSFGVFLAVPPPCLTKVDNLAACIS